MERQNSIQKRTLTKRFFVSLAIASATFAFAQQSKAATYNWIGGTGNWDTATANWTGAGTTWPAVTTSDDDAVFGGTAGTVTLTTGITANDLTFNTTGYTVTGNTLTLNGTTPTISAGTGLTATINSNVAGSVGFVKSGDGTVILGGTNALTGGVAINQGTLQIGTAANLLASNGLTLSGSGTLSMSTGMTLANNVTIASGQTGTLKSANANTPLTGNYTGMVGTLVLNMTANTSFSGFTPTSNNGPGGTVSVLASGQSQLGGAGTNFWANTILSLPATGLVYLNGTTTSWTFGALQGGSTNTIIGFDNNSGKTITINGIADATFAGRIFNGGGSAGANNVVKNGSSTQTFSGTNTYTGTTTINGGALSISAAANLPSTSAVTIANGSSLSISAPLTLANNITIVSGQSGTLANTAATGNVTISGNYSGVAGTLTFSGGTNPGGNAFVISSTTGPALGSVVNITQPNNTTFTFSNSTSLATQAFFANAKVVFPTNTGALTLFAGGNGVNPSNLQFGALDGGISSTNTGSYLGTTIGFDNRTGTVTINGTADGNFSGTIFNGNGSSGPASVIKNGASTQIFSGTNSYSGTTTINGGILQIGVVGNLPATGLTLSGGGALNMTGSMTRANNVTIASGQTGILKMVGATTGTLTGNYSGVAGTLILDVSGGSGYTGFVIGSANGPTAGSVVNILGTTNANNVQVGNNVLANQAFFGNAKVSITASGTGNTYLAFGGGTAVNAQFGALDGGNATTLIGFDNQSGRTVTINGTVAGNYSGRIFDGFGSASGLALIKNGAATQTLSGNNAYTGVTTVTGGTLLFNGTNTGTGGVTVNTGATLGGTGTLASTVLISANGTLSPGASIESLASGALTMSSGSTFFYEATGNGATGADLMKVTGALSLTNVTLDITGANLSAGTWLPGDKLTLISYTGTAITSGFATYTDDTAYTFGGNSWIINYNDTTKGANFNSEATGTSFVTLTVAAVPEPTTWAALLLGGAGLCFLRRKRV